MSRMRLILGVALTGFILATLPLASAQSRRSMSMGRQKPPRPEKPTKEHVTPLEQFQKMPPDQRQRELAKLPPDRREKLQKQLAHYDQLTPAQKEQLDWFNHMPAERKEEFRSAFQKFRSQPADRQQLMRTELNRLQTLPPGDREARLSSSEFQGKFSKPEQKILGDMANLLPDR